MPSPVVLQAPEPAAAPTPPPTATPIATLPEGGLLAYATVDGRIQTARPDGSAAKTISPDEGFFSWPTWSPDGRYLAFSGTSPGGNGPGPLALYLYDLEEERRRVLYFNDPGMGPILPNMPHYPLWAPDGERLSFMASAPLGLSLFIANVGGGDAPRVVVRNSPLYASWSADSRRMLVHAGIDHVLVDVGGGIAVRALDANAISYRAPAWWPSGDRVVLISDFESGDSELYISDLEREDQTLLTSLDGEAAFLWSPDGRSLAVGLSQLQGGFIYDGVTFYSPDGTKQSVEIEGEVISFFWSPDSSKLAYVTLSLGREELRWMVLDLNDGGRWPLVDFIPSEALATVFRFFDQFAYSHSPWSPDSGSLVFAGTLAGGATSASFGRQPVPGIFVVSVGPDPTVERVAGGVMAVWSPD
jgi:Tol biopolymer transport system component